MGMSIDEIKKEIYFAETVIKAIDELNVPMLINEEEKAVTKITVIKTFLIIHLVNFVILNVYYSYK